MGAFLNDDNLLLFKDENMGTINQVGILTNICWDYALENCV
jgi:hypothetical protein